MGEEKEGWGVGRKERRKVEGGQVSAQALLGLAVNCMRLQLIL